MTARPAAIAVALAVAAPAAAEPVTPPDPSVLEAADANLATEAHRRGVTFAASLGGGLLIGFGLQDSVGSGGAVSFRLGRVATPRTVLNLELQVTAALHRIATAGDVASNSETNLVVGPQYYVNPSFWVRAAAGLGVYKADQVPLSSGQLGTQTIVAPALVFGLGVDLIRIKSSVLGLELGPGMMISRTGVLITTSAAVGLAFD